MVVQYRQSINLPPLCAKSWQNTSSAVLEAFSARLNIDSPQNSAPCATPYIPPTRYSPARLQWSGHDPAHAAGDRRERYCWLSGAFVTIAGAALNHFAKGVVERDPVGRTLMKALHAAAEMELLWPKYRLGSGDHQRIGSPWETKGKYHADRPSAAARAQIAAERQQAIRFSQGAFRRGEGDRVPGELNQTHFNLNTHQQKLDNRIAYRRCLNWKYRPCLASSSA